MSKRILVTGSAGFIGSHFCEHILANTDWHIVALDGLNYAANLDRIRDSKHYDEDRITFVYHNLQSPIASLIHSKMGELNYVLHFAAESHVDRSLVDAIPFALTNVVGTTNLLEYIRKYQSETLERYIGFNTDEVFGPAPDGVYHTEDYKFAPSNPYAAAKAGQWAMEFAFAHFSGLPISMTHTMNAVGERQHPEKFLPMIIRNLLNGDKITLHATGGRYSTRCWIHPRTISDALVFLLDNAETEESYNIVGEEMSVYDIANWVCQTVKGRDLKESDYECKDAHSQRPGHDFRYALDGTKLKEMGWTPPVILRKSLKKTVQWCMKPKNRHWLGL